MTVDTVKESLGLKTASPSRSDFPTMLKQYQAEIARALPKHLSADRMARIALTEFRKNKALAECSPKSIFASIIMAAQLGLEPGIIGQGYLVPYNGECQFIPGWQGLIDLVSRTGRAAVWTGAVFIGDDFDYMLGDAPYVKHRPFGEDDPDKITHVYAIGQVNGCQSKIIEVWPIARIKKHRDKNNKLKNKMMHYSFKHFEMYARKVVMLQVLKYLPKSVELSSAVSLEYASEVGAATPTMDEAIEGVYDIVPQQELESELPQGAQA